MRQIFGLMNNGNRKIHTKTGMCPQGEEKKNRVLLVWGLLFAGLNLGFASFVLAADKIILKNNNVIEGKIIKAEAGQIVIETYEGKAFLTIPRRDIAQIILEKPESFASAQALFEKGDYAGAIKLYKQVIEEYSNYDWAQKALFQIGYAYMGLKNWGQAGEVFQKYLKNYPESEMTNEVNLCLGEVLANQARHKEAASFYQKVVGLENREDLQVRAQFGLAEMSLVGEQYEEAILGYLRIAVVFYDEKEWVPRAMFKAGICYEKLGDLGRARQIYEEIRADYPRTEYARLSEKKLSELPQKENVNEIKKIKKGEEAR